MQSHCGTRFLCGKCEPIVYLSVAIYISPLIQSQQISSSDRPSTHETPCCQHEPYTISGSSPASSLPSWSSPWPHRWSHPGQKHSRSCSRHHDRTEDGSFSSKLSSWAMTCSRLEDSSENPWPDVCTRAERLFVLREIVGVPIAGNQAPEEILHQ